MKLRKIERTGWTMALAACIMGTVAFSASRATVNPRYEVRQDTLLTTQSGVFSEDQATRGKSTYSSICLSCHAPASQAGDSFDSKWKDHPLNDLYQYIVTQMPQNDPGSLDPYVTADVVAYMLKLNAMPSGTADLTPDTLLLKKIRITRTKGSTP